MAKLPTDLSGLEVRAALERAGFIFRRQTGSHMVLRRDQPYAGSLFPITSEFDPARCAGSSRTPVSQSISSCNCSDDELPLRARNLNCGTIEPLGHGAQARLCPPTSSGREMPRPVSFHVMTNLEFHSIAKATQ